MYQKCLEPFKLYEEINLSNNYFGKFDWEKETLAIRQEHFQILSNCQKADLMDIVNQHIRNLHGDLVQKHANEFYIPNWILPDATEITDNKILAAEKSLYKSLRIESKNALKKQKKLVEDKKEKILTQNRKGYGFPTIQPPNAADLYFLDIQKSESTAKSTLQNQWMHLTKKEKEYYKKLVYKSIVKHFDKAENPALLAISEERWFCLTRKEIEKFGHFMDIEKYEKEWKNRLEKSENEENTEIKTDYAKSEEKFMEELPNWSKSWGFDTIVPKSVSDEKN